MMDMHSRNQYLKVLQLKYQEVNKKEKTEILDEYCQNTDQNRDYVIRKMNSKTLLKRSGKRGKGLTAKLYHEYQAKKDSQKVEIHKNLHPSMVRFNVIEKTGFRLGSYMS